MNLLEWIGAFTLAVLSACAVLVAWALILEAVRSYRQTCRVARWTAGSNWRAKARKEWRVFVRMWRREFGRGYHSIEIRGLVFPYNPREPLRRIYYG